MQIENNITQIKKALFSFFNLCLYLGERSKKDNILQISAALAYTSLVGLVPLMAIALAIFSAFPVFEAAKDDLQVFIFKNFAPHASEALKEKIANFVVATSGLTAIGVVGLAFTSVFMLNKIEDAFNSIFRVSKSRTIIARIMMYWTIVTFGPLLIGAGFSFSGYLDSAKSWFQEEVAVSETDLNRIIPFILFTFGFTLFYVAVPNCIVKIKHGLIGGFFSAIFYNILKISFGYFVVMGSSYQIIYGALAALPLFLLWIYSSWAMILFGAEITAAIPEWQSGAKPNSKKDKINDDSPARFVVIAISLIQNLWQATKDIRQTKKNKHLADFNVPEVERLFIINKLKQNNIIALTENGELVLTKDPSSFTVLDIAEMFGATIQCDINKFANSELCIKMNKLFAETQKAENKHLAIPVIELW